LLTDALEASAARHGFDLQVTEAEYGQVMRAAQDPASAINRERLDAVLIALDYRGLHLPPTPGNPDGAAQTVDAAMDFLRTIRDAVKSHGHGACIVQTLACPPEAGFGSFEASLPGTLRHLIGVLNRRLADALYASDDIVFDVAGIAESVGLADWHDPTQWNMAKLPFCSDFVPLYADRLATLIAAIRGKNRRCLVLDLDNTVWGGVIGDDGMTGISIAQGDATGEAHLAVQQAALALRSRGVVLAVSSKNNDDVARQPFREHPDMLLREEHIAVFQANWNDKATNIRAIADELSLGLDAFVFLDDNPVERELVRRSLPQVAVPELPTDPALYARTLLAAGYFEAIAYSAEDSQRADFYRDNARRAVLQKSAVDMDGYLATLDMTMTVQAFDAIGRARITQLINKSNQFNLTARRYTDAEVDQVAAQPDCLTLQIRLTDVFGDNGMISVVICRPAGSDWVIDTWLMSCRVLGRKVERAVLQEILGRARSQGIARLVGRYVPTDRNAMVKDHYAGLGFAPAGQDADGSSLWALDVVSAPLETLPIVVRH
jgi:FkbH-like protein